MTPKFKYDPDHHCLREVARVREPIRYMFHLARTYQLARQSYEQHLASLRVIKCFAHSWWTEGDYVEGVSFEVIKGIDGERAIPKDHKQPRLYTQAEAEEIWRGGYDCGHAEAARDDYTDKQQFFLTRFNVEL